MTSRAAAAERVVQLLLDQDKITRGQLNEARRTQQFFGGQLASHLLKLGFVDEQMLGDALTEVTGAPYASYDRLRAVSGDAQSAIPVHLLETHRACPLAREGETLRVAMLDPRNVRALRELEASSGLRVQPWVTTEYRLYQALERYYRIQPEGLRSLSLAPPSEMRELQLRELAEAEAERAAEDLTEAEVEEAIGLDGLPLDAELDPGTDWQDRARRPAVDPAEAQGSAPLVRLEATLAGGPDRDAIAAALVEFCAGHASRVGLFLVGQHDIRGVAGRGRGFHDDTLGRLTLPRGGGTVFDTALQSRDFYYGVVPALPANRELYAFLGGRTPPTVLLVPVQVRKRTVALLYLDNDRHPLGAPDIPLIRRVAIKAGLALELLILRTKLLGI